MWLQFGIITIILIMIYLLMKRGPPNPPPSPPPNPPPIDVCTHYWKYGPSSIKYSSNPGQYTCDNTKVPDYCYLPFDEGVKLCILNKKCVGFLVGDSKYVQLIDKQPSNYNKPTNMLYYEKKVV